MKICLALNDKNFEEYIKKKLLEKDSTITFTTPALYSDMVVTICKQDLPDILLLNEALPSTSSKSNNNDKNHHMSFGEMIGWVRKNTNTRVIFICSTRPAGDKFLRSIVNLGIYDIISGDTVKVSEIISCIFNPKNLSDIDYLIEVEEMTNAIPDTKSTEPVKVTDEINAESNSTNKKVEKKSTEIKKKNNQPAKAQKNMVNNQVTAAVAPQALNNNNNKESYYDEPDSMILTADIMPKHFKKKENFFIFDMAADMEIAPFVNANSGAANNLSVINNNTYYNNYPNYNYGNYMGGYNGGFANYGKIFLFLNVREGDGVTTITTNTAFAAAFTYPNKKFLIIDAMPGKTTLFDRLYLPKGGVRLDTMEGVGNAGISKMQIINSNINDATRFKEYPENLVFLRTSGDFMQTGNMDKIRQNLTLLKAAYDYIFINASGKYYTDFLKTLTEASDNICFVITQDYENLMAISNQNFDNTKCKIVINRYVGGCDLNEEYISRTFALSNDNIKKIAFDSGFVKYQTKGLPLYPYARFKTRQALNSILSMFIN